MSSYINKITINKHTSKVYPTSSAIASPRTTFAPFVLRCSSRCKTY